ncbi:MAG: NfeD family protein [Alphaproteobacteria bacterium]|nr:NfeD family protein [Alphaproteobacteria bacterium]MBU0798415.1 NfeD family protein [Alphaproteobacteria bacterium]MBU0889094.1 NfeD family protein [Alphaproteobacteria bacterium]MBU1813277.1 NfeD family protein [Alphaproteobacteria bacterium]MBU2091764.1 NfeD family protein [Alphaproteobacteria bacterium]
MIGTIFDTSWAWIIAGMILAGLEIILPGIFLLWVGLGALAVGLILSIAPGLPLPWQALVFALSMLSSLGLGFWIQRRSRATGEDSFLNREMEAMIGQEYIAITTFVAGRGRIKVRDSSYAAVSDEAIAEGDLVTVIGLSDDRPRVVKAPRS